MAGEPRLIALDWGSTSCRAYLVDAEGTVVARRDEPLGILSVPKGEFAAALSQLVDPWLAQAGDLPLIAGGMIGSRQGWREAPYVACPAAAADLAGRLTAVEAPGGRRLWLVPGLTDVGEDGVPDAMRGEETQIVGCLEPRSNATRVFLLPGTHSKWVLVEGERIRRFATFMTGELFALLKSHSILGRLMQGEAPDAAAFGQGVDRAGRADHGLLHGLFSVRTLGLFERLPAAGLASYLSGLLIGSEIAEARRWLGSVGETGPITIIGGETLAGLYRDGLTAAGLASGLGPPDAVVPGLFRIAHLAGLLE